VPAVGPGTAGRYPTQKPDGLGRVLARMAGIGPGDIVLDPFVGSGALLVGARERGAHVLGCDIAPLAIRQATIKLGPPGTTARPARSSSSSARRGGRRPAPKGQPRMAGRGSLAGLLAYGDANAIVVEMAAEVLPVVKDTPVLAGINGTDPFRLMPVFLKQLKEIGFSGVQNFPTVGLIDGDFRANLEATGMDYAKEIAAIGLAHELDLFTSPYVFNADDAKAMAKAGADVLVAHMGLTTAGTIGAGVALTLDQAIERVMTIAEAGKSVRSDILVICHGGPFDEPQNVGTALARMPGIAGFFGASSIERLPTERAIRGQVEEFKGLKLAAAAVGV
jgi:predicted TIM-barrel enzyme